MLWKSRFALGLNTRLEPVNTFDYFEPRTDDFSRFMTWPTNYTAGGFVSSDYRKPFAYDIRMSYRYFDAENRNNTNIVLAPRLRLSDRLSVFTNTSLSIINFEPGYVNKNLSDTPIDGLAADDILFGNRNRLIVDNSITTRYIFNALIGINMRIRHYWDKVRYQQFGRLDKDGFVEVIPYSGLDANGDSIFDRNVNIFNIDFQCNWRFAPGSDVIFVWKNQISNSDKQYERDYLANLGGLFESLQTNSFSVRVLYFLDYLYVFPRKES